MNRDGPHPDDERDAVEETAVQWLIERDEGFAPGRAAGFEQWRSAHPEHASAVDRLEQTWGILEDLPALRPAAAARSASAAKARRCRAAVWLPLAAAAIVVLAFAGWRIGSRDREASYTTVAQRVERVTLPEGSVVTLNSGSEARVHYSRAERRVLLAAGEAHFEVAHDAARPFLVTADGVTVRAVGTAFNVRVGAATVEVVVASGKVRLINPASVPAPTASTEPSLPPPPLLEAGDRAVVSRGDAQREPAITRLEPQQLREMLAWQQEALVFSKTPLREVVAQFNRHNRLQLRLGDAELGERLIGGTFAAGNVAAFVTLLERSGDLQSDRTGEGEIILRKAR